MLLLLYEETMEMFDYVPIQRPNFNLIFTSAAGPPTD